MERQILYLSLIWGVGGAFTIGSHYIGSYLNAAISLSLTYAGPTSKKALQALGKRHLSQTTLLGKHK